MVKKDKKESDDRDEDEDIPAPIDAFAKMTEMIIRMLGAAMNVPPEELEKSSRIEIHFTPPGQRGKRKNIRFSERKARRQKEYMDIVDAGNFISVIIEFPGVEAEPAVTHKKPNLLVARVGNSVKTVPIPYTVDWKKMSFTFKNGILEVILPKK